MSTREPLVRHISRPRCSWLFTAPAKRNALMPFSAIRSQGRLAGERGDQIAKSMPFSKRATWAWITRVYAYDEFIKQQVGDGVDMVVNLAAGLDARPYRMSLRRRIRRNDRASPCACFAT